MRGVALLGSRGHLAKSLECLRAHKCSLVTEESFTVLWLARGYGFMEATEVRPVGTSTCVKRARLPPARKTTGIVVTSPKMGVIGSWTVTQFQFFVCRILGAAAAGIKTSAG